MNRNPDVDAWLEAYDNPMKPVVMAVREAILASDDRMSETIKWQAPTFMYKGNLASFFPKAIKLAAYDELFNGPVPLLQMYWNSFYVAAITTIGVMLTPVVGIFSSAAVLGEPLGWQEYVALVLVVAAIGVPVLTRPAAQPATDR